MEGKAEPKKAISLTPLQAIVELVRRGHRNMLPRLRELLRKSPEVVVHVGDLARQSRQAWAQMIGGPDDLLRESILLYAEERIERLAGRGASELEKLAAARIVAAEMEVEYLDIWRLQHPEVEGTRLAETREKRFAEAERRLDRAIKSLATVKKLLPRTIQVELLHPRKVQAPVAPIVPSMNGAKRSPCAEPASSFNGHNRFGGGCFAGAVEPVGVGEG